MNKDQTLWNLFEKSGSIDLYMMYKSLEMNTERNNSGKLEQFYM